MAAIKIHGFAPSTYTRTVRMGAIELDIEHQLVPLAFGQPEHFALHPFGKMPALTDGDVTVYETLAILAYLDGRRGNGVLFPQESMRQNLAACSVGIDYAYRPVVHVDPKDQDCIDAASRVFDWMETTLAGRKTLAGQEVGAADLLFAPMLDYHVGEAGADRLWFERPNLEAWFAAINERRSFADTKVSD